MEDRKYSVLMSVYTKENPVFFKLSIESMINQSLTPDEIVIVKDGPITKELEKIIPSYADILTLKYYYEYSNLEISKLLNIMEGNVRVRLYRAKQSIKKILLESVNYDQI